MPEGFQSINNGNSYQIDGDNVNLSFVRKGSVSTSYSSTYKRGLVTIAIAGDEILVLRCSSTYCALVYRNATEAKVSTDLAVGGTIIDYWVFGRSGYTTSGFGLQVFGPGSGSLASRIVYDSNYKPFSVAGAITGGGVSAVSMTFPAGRSYGTVAQQTYAIYNRAKTDIGWGVMNFSLDSTRVNANVVYSQLRQVLAYDGQMSDSTIEGTWDNDVTSIHLVVDVTGL